mgnify:FL=1
MIKFHKTLSTALSKTEHVSFIAPESAYKKGTHKKVLDESLWSHMSKELKDVKAGLTGRSLKTFTNHKTIRSLELAVLPNKVSRGNSPTRKEWVYKFSAAVESHPQSTVVLVLDDAEHYAAAASAVARHARLFTAKTGKATKKKQINIVAIDHKGDVIAADKTVSAAADGVAWACKMVDSPPTDMNPKALAAEAKALFKGNKSVSAKEITGSQ